MKINEIRDAIQTLNWVRRDSTGGTVEENKRTNLPALLAPHVAKVLALAIPTRFARDIESKADALDAAATVIARWHELQPATATR